MNKIRLDPESLEVITFAPSQDPQGRGTVLAAATGYTCYNTIMYDRRTICMGYELSHWGEDTCIIYCPLVEVTDPSVCLNTAAVTCIGQTGC